MQMAHLWAAAIGKHLPRRPQWDFRLECCCPRLQVVVCLPLLQPHVTLIEDIYYIYLLYYIFIIYIINIIYIYIIYIINIIINIIYIYNIYIYIYILGLAV
jgi:hypothetical protein